MKNILQNLNINLQSTKRVFNDIHSITLNSDIDFFSNGKGFDISQAQNSAYGEMCERLITRNYFEDYFLAKVYPDSKVVNDFLEPSLKKFYNISELQKEDLIDFSSCSDDILSIPFIRQSDNKKIYFPINIIQNLYASNGMAFFDNQTIAFENALSEIIERYVKFEVIKNGLNLPKINHKYNSKYIQVYDSSLNQYPVMAVSYIKNNKILLSFGCDINQEKAINKAYLEIMQGRDNLYEDMGEICNELFDVQDSFNLEKHFISNNGLVYKGFLNKNTAQAKKWNFTKYQINKEIYFREYKLNNYFAYQIIIPDFSEIYPIDDLIFNNKNQGKFYRELILKYKKFDKSYIIDELSQLNPHLDLGKFIGVIFEEDISINDFIQMIKKEKINLKFDKKYLKIQLVLNKLNQINKIL